MSWVVLVLSGCSDGLSRPGPVAVFAVALAASTGGLALAMRELPTGTAYVVWVGIGAVLTVAYAMVTGEEPVSLVRVLLVLGVIGCVVGLKLTH